VKFLVRRALAFFIVVAGIFTFFYSSVTTDPPIAGVVRWSPVNIVVQMHNGMLPSPVCERCGEPLVRSLLALPLSITVQYLLMGLALIVLCFRRSSKILISIAIVGIYTSLRGGWGVAARLEFLATFFGLSRRGHVHYTY
jgi:hypothetical protein